MGVARSIPIVGGTLVVAEISAARLDPEQRIARSSVGASA
jgi:hypothetical protein